MIVHDPKLSVLFHAKFLCIYIYIYIYIFLYIYLQVNRHAGAHDKDGWFGRNGDANGGSEKRQVLPSRCRPT